MLGYIVYSERIISRNKGFSFTFLSLASLVVAWSNIKIGSFLVGSFVLIAFFMPMTILTGSVFFKKEHVTLRLTFGFALLLAIIVFFGTLTYLAVDYSWSSMLVLLIMLTLSLSYLNRRMKESLKGFPYSESKFESEKKCLKNYARDAIFLLFILLSLHAIYVGRTGESIRTFWETVDADMFFLPYFGASFIAVLTIFSRKTSVTKGLLCVIVLATVAAILPILVLEYPQTNVMGRLIAHTRQFDEFGRFVSESQQTERASGIIHKQLEFTGYYVIMVSLSRLLGSDPATFNVLLTPLLFAFYAPISAYIIIKTAFPNRPKTALMSALALMASQHNFHLLVPPGKPETLGLVFLLLSITFWTRYLVRKESSTFSSMLIPLFFSIAAVFSHPNVGVFSLSLTVMSIYLRIVKPHEPSKKSFRSNLLDKLGFVILTITLSLSLILAYRVFASLGVQTYLTFTPTYNLNEWMKVLFPPFESLQAFSLEGIRDLYLNNFTYVWYALLVGGIFLSHRWRVNPIFLWLNLPLIFMSFVSMILQQHFYP